MFMIQLQSVTLYMCLHTVFMPFFTLNAFSYNAVLFELSLQVQCAL